MKQGTTLFLKISLVVVGIIILSMSLFLLPWLSQEAIVISPDLSYLQYPVLIGIYVTAIPFFIALYQSFALLKRIDEHNAFSYFSVKALKNIKQCAMTIAGLYTLGIIALFFLHALHPSIALVGLAILFASVIIAVFASLLQKLLLQALLIKSENELTV
ncbi:DUF2975 domain-containing protein [Paenalkalicoccus suaedae]|uniref:DUF2975 domain-containing protein n=1 Tax=Paenalkalicoccus suaedae TaxID=2592382 RepID=A0A859FCA7_9BACI|nr:DUF2975 domain-containing protein [Paenalkalicoccus suaedae]QKS70402.1 DUF2975 domain-containing protein [Paenalkalicoccus suaedae]